MSDFRFMLDSNICIYLLKFHSKALSDRVADQDEGSLCISSIVLAELAISYGRGVFDTPELRQFVDQIPVVAFDDRAAMLYGTLPFRRARFDRLIAAHALALDVGIVTNNEADFVDVPGLKVENWTI